MKTCTTETTVIFRTFKVSLMGTVYKITNQLCCTTRALNTQVKDKQGKLLSTEEEQAKRWVEHFKEVLNYEDPATPVNPTPTDEDINIDTSPPTLHEIQ